MSRRVTMLEVWIEPKGVWAGILRMLGYYPARRRGVVPSTPREVETWEWVSGFPACVVDQSKRVGAANVIVTKYDTARQFDCEGDLYESITGHRSAVIDEADRKRGGSK